MVEIIHNSDQNYILFPKDKERIDIFEEKEISSVYDFEKDSSGLLLIILKNAKVHMQINLAERAKLQIFFFCIGEKGSQISLNASLNLIGNNAEGNAHVISFLEDDSKVAVDAKINISPNISKVVGHLLEENILLGKRIKLKTLPLLDVSSPDVIASHGAKVQKLDPEKIFYIQSKGLSESEAKKMVVDAYREDILSHFSLTQEEMNLLTDKMKIASS